MKATGKSEGAAVESVALEPSVVSVIGQHRNLLGSAVKIKIENYFIFIYGDFYHLNLQQGQEEDKLSK